MNTRITALALAASLALMVSGCKGGGGGAPGGKPSGGASGEGGGGGCGAPTVTVDGQPIAGLTHGYAITHKRNGDLVQQVDLYNHEAECAELLSRSGRTVPDGEEAVRAFTGGSGAFGRGLGIEAHTQLGVDVELASVDPKAPGDKVAVCVPETTFKPAAGKYKDRSVTMSGRFEGAWCGLLDWDAK